MNLCVLCQELTTVTDCLLVAENDYSIQTIHTTNVKTHFTLSQQTVEWSNSGHTANCKLRRTKLPHSDCNQRAHFSLQHPCYLRRCFDGVGEKVARFSVENMFDFMWFLTRRVGVSAGPNKRLLVSTTLNDPFRERDDMDDAGDGGGEEEDIIDPLGEEGILRPKMSTDSPVDGLTMRFLPLPTRSNSMCR